MAHDPVKVEIAQMFGHNPDDIYGAPPKKASAKKPQGFQEEVATVEELLGELPPEEEMAPAEEMPMEEEEEVQDDIDSLISRLQSVMDMEDASAEDKKSAEEMMTRLEELRTAKENAEAFLAEKETPVVEEEAPVAPEGGGEEVIMEGEMTEEEGV